MFKLLARLWAGASPALADPHTSSGFQQTQVVDSRPDTRPSVAWSARSAEVGALGHDRARATMLLGQLLAADGQAALNAERERRLLASYLDFSEVPAQAAVVRQDERGDYLMILLEGRVAMERLLPSGTRVRLGDARAGDLLGELTLLDPHTRYSQCTTRTPCVFAVLKPQSLEWMMRAEPRLSSLLLVWLARRLSAHLRRMSARVAGLAARA